ncbi:MAG: MBL fold metallo-hydrolase [Chloroflexi bacterium]|nr:MBL fold metallo-hydrolase [Chloroflexota bacterium]
MDLEIFVTPGLGDNSYLLVSGDNSVMVDPQRDAWRFLAVAKRRNLQIRHVLETHVHNDYVSGAREIAECVGAEIVAPLEGGYKFNHRGVSEGDEIGLGKYRIAAWDTPGHTPEHISYLVLDSVTDEPIAIFSGGSLIVQSAGRTDLLGEARAAELTASQYESVNRIGALPSNVQLLPTHGAGSFCAASTPGGMTISTIGVEQTSNIALGPRNLVAFAAQQLSGLQDYPAYYAFMAGINRTGPPILGKVPDSAAMSANAVTQAISSGTVVIDARPPEQFATGHIDGSLNIKLDDSFGTYVGWLIEFNKPLALVLPTDRADAWDEAATQLLRIGWDNVLGHLEGGLDAWQEAGGPVALNQIATLDDLYQEYTAPGPLTIFDVRQQDEWEVGHIPGSTHFHIGDFISELPDLPRDSEIWTVCASGDRSAIAASVLLRAGWNVRVVRPGGVPDWAAKGYPVSLSDE